MPWQLTPKNTFFYDWKLKVVTENSEKIFKTSWDVIAQKNFNVWSEQTKLSKAPNPDWFRHTNSENDTIEKSNINACY